MAPRLDLLQQLRELLGLLRLDHHPDGEVARGRGALSLRAGLNDPKDPNIAVQQYLPQSLTVTAGTTVEWRIAGPEPHTVTFLPPGAGAAHA